MSVNKLDFTYIKQSKKGFTTFLNDVLQHIPDFYTLGLYTYLCSLPHNWQINRQQLMNHCGNGKHKVNDALAWLNKNHLIAYEQERDEKGLWITSSIVVKDGTEFIEKVVKNQSNSTEQPGHPETGSPDYRVTRKSATTNNIYNKNNNNNKNTEVIHKQEQKTKYVSCAKIYSEPRENINSYPQKTEPRCNLKYWEKGNPDFDKHHAEIEKAFSSQKQKSLEQSLTSFLKT